MNLNVLEYTLKVPAPILTQKFEEMQKICPLFEINSEYVIFLINLLEKYPKVNFLHQQNKSLKDLIVQASHSVDLDKKSFLKQKNKNIQALIVKYLKENTQSDFDEIFNHVKKILKADFLTFQDLEPMIESLIEKDFIEKSENNPNRYCYC